MSFETEFDEALFRSEERYDAGMRSAQWRLERLQHITRALHPNVPDGARRSMVTLAYLSTLSILEDVSDVVQLMRERLSKDAFQEMAKLVAIARVDRRRPYDGDLATEDDWQAWMARL